MVGKYDFEKLFPMEFVRSHLFFYSMIVVGSCIYGQQAMDTVEIEKVSIYSEFAIFFEFVEISNSQFLKFEDNNFIFQ